MLWILWQFPFCNKLLWLYNYTIISVMWCRLVSIIKQKKRKKRNKGESRSSSSKIQNLIFTYIRRVLHILAWIFIKNSELRKINEEKAITSQFDLTQFYDIIILNSVFYLGFLTGNSRSHLNRVKSNKNRLNFWGLLNLKRQIANVMVYFNLMIRCCLNAIVLLWLIWY